MSTEISYKTLLLHDSVDGVKIYICYNAFGPYSVTCTLVQRSDEMAIIQLYMRDQGQIHVRQLAKGNYYLSDAANMGKVIHAKDVAIEQAHLFFEKHSSHSVEPTGLDVRFTPKENLSAKYQYVFDHISIPMEEGDPEEARVYYVGK